ncbi:hypothetical protein KJ673_04290 [Patescibacteria group bacterium]|nr:hypothetical protein [Patescibacteria group bacterium]MCG2687626.1 hypothetical protein [Candidatus Parcubacteria bacterium]
MRKMSLASPLVLAALTGCGDITHNFIDDTGADFCDADDMDCDGVTDGSDSDEVIGPIADYPGEVWFSTGTLNFPWFGEAMTFECHDRWGTDLEFVWDSFIFTDDDQTYQNTWLYGLLDDRATEGAWLCAFTREGKSVLDMTKGNDPLVWTPKSVCIQKINTAGLYEEPGNNSCDDVHVSW